MKIAITNQNDEVFQHFGKCESFTVFEIENDDIVSKNILNSNGVGHGALAGLLKENNVDILICGGIGEGAKQALKAESIEIIAGASGSIDNVIKSYMDKTLVNDDSFKCEHHEHGHEHSCGNHNHCN